MSPQAERSIIAMLNSFPQTNQDYRLLLASLAQHCAHLSDHAIIEAADRFVAGEVAEQSKKFAPSIAEFVEEAKRRQEYIDLRSRPRLEAPKCVQRGTAPFETEVEKARQRFRGLPVIAENVSFEDFRRLSATKQIPAGAVWSAALATIFGPAPAAGRLVA